MILLKEDLKDIGHTTMYDDNRNTVIVTNGDNIGIERIMIRNILLQFGNYSIVKERDIQYPKGHCDWEFITNLPWSEYEKLK